MFRPPRILMTTDLSPLSWKAWPTALSLAQEFQIPLFVLHVLETGKETNLEEEIENADSTIRETLENLAEKRTDGGLVEIVVTPSNRVVSRILDQVERLDVGLVVTATHGRSGLGNIVYGSTAERLVRSCPVPVVSVRVKDLETPPEDLEEALEHRKKVVAPLEGR